MLKSQQAFKLNKECLLSDLQFSLGDTCVGIQLCRDTACCVVIQHRYIVVLREIRYAIYLHKWSATSCIRVLWLCIWLVWHEFAFETLLWQKPLHSLPNCVSFFEVSTECHVVVLDMTGISLFSALKGDCFKLVSFSMNYNMISRMIYDVLHHSARVL